MMRDKCIFRTKIIKLTPTKANGIIRFHNYWNFVYGNSPFTSLTLSHMVVYLLNLTQKFLYKMKLSYHRRDKVVLPQPKNNPID